MKQLLGRLLLNVQYHIRLRQLYSNQEKTENMPRVISVLTAEAAGNEGNEGGVSHSLCYMGLRMKLDLNSEDAFIQRLSTFKNNCRAYEALKSSIKSNSTE